MFAELVISYEIIAFPPRWLFLAIFPAVIWSFSCYHHGVWGLFFKMNCWHSSRSPLSWLDKDTTLTGKAAETQAQVDSGPSQHLKAMLAQPAIFFFLSLSLLFQLLSIFTHSPLFLISETTYESTWGSTLNHFSALKNCFFIISSLPPGLPRKWHLSWESPQFLVSPWPTHPTN